MSAAWAGATCHVTVASNARAMERRRMIGVLFQPVIPGRALARTRNLEIPGSLALLPPRNDGCSKTRSCGHSFPSNRSPSTFQLLLLVADAIDRAGPVVRNQHGAILGQNDIGRPAEITLVAFEPARGKDLLLGVLAVRTDDDAFDARALIFVPVPGAVFGDEDVVLVLGGELVAGIELHAERSHMRAKIEHRRGEFRTFVTHRKLRIRQVALVAIGIAEMLAELRDHVELVARDVVAHPVTGRSEER